MSSFYDDFDQKHHCHLEKTLQNKSCVFTCTIVSTSGIFYRSPGHPGNRYSVDDHPVIIRQGSHVWIGPAAGIEIWLRREGCCDGLQICFHRTGLQEHTHTLSMTKLSLEWTLKELMAMYYYLVVRHLKDVAEASSTDVICYFIGDLKRVLKWGSSYCGHIWAGNKVYKICLVHSQNLRLEHQCRRGTFRNVYSFHLEAGKLGLKEFCSLPMCLHPAPLSPGYEPEKE